MYFYYACTTIGIHPPGKQWITRLQITQFIVGGSLAVSYLVLPGCLKGEGAVKEPLMEQLAVVRNDSGCDLEAIFSYQFYQTWLLLF